MMKHLWVTLPYRSKMAVGLAIVFLLYLGVTFMVTQGVSGYMDSRQRLTEINRIQAQRDALFLSLQDAETGQRGYIITGNESYLMPYRAATQRIPKIFRRLEKTLANDPFQYDHLLKLETLTQSKLHELKSSVALRGTMGFSAAAERVSSGTGQHTMDQIRQVMREMQDEYNQQQQTQTSLTNQSIRYMLNILSVSQIMAFGILLLLYVLIYREALQRTQAERRLKETNDNLEQIVAQRTDELRKSNQELEQFAFIASHDLQAPLRKIQMFTELLREELAKQALTDTAQDYMERVQKSVDRMQGLIVDLLAISRINRKGAAFKMVDLKAVVGEAVDELTEAIQKNEGHIELGPMCEVEADPEQMRQLLINLVSNALKYHRDGVTPEVKITSSLKDNEVCELVVEDNGIGIPPEYQDKVFEIFQRLHGGKYEGNGIGLSIVKRIVERHGGHVKVDSALGQGSQFIVELPVHHVGA